MNINHSIVRLLLWLALKEALTVQELLDPRYFQDNLNRYYSEHWLCTPYLYVIFKMYLYYLSIEIINKRCPKNKVSYAECYDENYEGSHSCIYYAAELSVCCILQAWDEIPIGVLNESKLYDVELQELIGIYKTQRGGSYIQQIHI